MENFSKWDDQEVKTLFKFVEVKKSEGVPLIQIFAEYANKTFRQQNSVRNYYYKELANLQIDNERVKLLKINLDNHVVNKGKPFSKEEEQDVINQIDKLVENGYSVRKACLKLSNGNVPQMLRFQNKYRSVNKKNKESTEMGQIIKMPTKSSKLSEDDIKALFIGIVRLVKKQEQENAKACYMEELFNANEKFKHAIAELAVKQNKIKKLETELYLTKLDLEKQKEIVIKREDRVNKVCKDAKSTIKTFFENNKNDSLKAKSN